MLPSLPGLEPTPSGVIGFRLVHALAADESTGSTFRLAYTGGPPSSADLSTLAGLVNTAWGDNLASFMSDAGLLVETQARDLANPSTTIGNSVAGIDGTRSGGTADIARSAVQFFRPDRTFRGSRPKMFLPYGVDADVSGGFQWTTAFVTDLQIALNAFYAALDGGVGGSTHLALPVCVSYSHGFTVVTSGTTGRARNVPTPRVPPLVTASLGIEVSSRIGTQRRRIAAS
jgi:hypothetical protein